MTEQKLFKLIIPAAIKRGIIHKKTRVGKKSDFWYHKWINFILNIVYSKKNKDLYLKGFWTTIGFDIAGPDDSANEEGEFHHWYTLGHELKHVKQAMRLTRLLFGFLYLWALSQGLLLAALCWLPVFWSSGWVTGLWIAGWLVIAGLHFIPQLPDPFRMKYELEGYAISMYFYLDRFGSIDDGYIDHLVNNFNSMAYYIMEPNRGKIKKILRKLSVEITMDKHPVKHDPIVKLIMELKSGDLQYQS